jgi:hypothetical protein
MSSDHTDFILNKNSINLGHLRWKQLETSYVCLCKNASSDFLCLIDEALNQADVTFVCAVAFAVYNMKFNSDMYFIDVNLV